MVIRCFTCLTCFVLLSFVSPAHDTASFLYVQVSVPQQPGAPTRGSGSDGLCTCGVNVALNLRRFIEGVEAYCKLKAAKRTKGNCITLQWVDKHMRTRVSARTMEQARATGLLYLLQTAVYEGTGVTADDAEYLLTSHYEAGYALLRIRSERAAVELLLCGTCTPRFYCNLHLP